MIDLLIEIASHRQRCGCCSLATAVRALLLAACMEAAACTAVSTMAASLPRLAAFTTTRKLKPLIVPSTPLPSCCVAASASTIAAGANGAPRAPDPSTGVAMANPTPELERSQLPAKSMAARNEAR